MRIRPPCIRLKPRSTPTHRCHEPRIPGLAPVAAPRVLYQMEKISGLGIPAVANQRHGMINDRVLQKHQGQKLSSQRDRRLKPNSWLQDERPSRNDRKRRKRRDASGVVLGFRASKPFGRPATSESLRSLPSHDKRQRRSLRVCQSGFAKGRQPGCQFVAATETPTGPRS